MKYVSELKSAPDVNAYNSAGNTALHIASIYGFHEVVKELLAIPGIKVDAQIEDSKSKNYKMTPLKLAVKLRHKKVIEAILDFKKSELKVALEKGDEKNAIKLLNDLMNQPEIFKHIDQYMFIAARNQCINFIEGLIRLGINVNVQNKDGMTALHIAAEQGDLAMVTALLKLNAETKRKTQLGKLAIDFAKTDAIRKLILHTQIDKYKATCSDTRYHFWHRERYVVAEQIRKVIYGEAKIDTLTKFQKKLQKTKHTELRDMRDDVMRIRKSGITKKIRQQN